MTSEKLVGNRLALTVLFTGSLMLTGCADHVRQIEKSDDAVVLRQPYPDYPIAASVEVAPAATTVYLSGIVPPETSPGQYGDTEQQTVGVLRSMEKQLHDMGMTLGDIVKMQVFLVAAPDNDGRMDFDGFMRGYTQFFGTAEQPNLPARSAFQIAALGDPGWLIEIEAIAVRGAAAAK